MTTEFASSIFGIVSSTIISIVFAIYIIAQKETLVRQIDKVMNAYEKVYNRLLTEDDIKKWNL